ncbi:hypothetical protein F5Y18DRAFT_133460 [Xylariaceae sp. FL1019]|nr:hypothetical protein F5Y18DRAFT_133460 [Xylariaceae sp. FL1019]
MPRNEQHVRFNNNNSNYNDDLYRTQTAELDYLPPQVTHDHEDQSGRRRSSSDPSGRGRQRPKLAVIRPRREGARAGMVQIPENQRLASTAVFNAPGRRNAVNEELADVLDVIDPEVSTLNTATNIQNSLFVPSLGRFINRRPTYNLTQAPEHQPKKKGSKASLSTRRSSRASLQPEPFQQGPQLESPPPEYDFDFNHAVLPDGVSLEGWTKEEMAELNDHVRHMMHSRRSKFKRTMRAFRQYVKTPLGLFITVYATLITLFGAAWVLFLIGWIYVGGKQLVVVNAIDYTLVALFGLVGDLLAPFRLVDTYHMCFIAHYYRKTWKLRKKLQMSELKDKNDLPTNPRLEEAHDEISVLTEAQQASLVHHQNKFAKSHTFYRPHETKTHYAFPLSFLIAVVLLLDLHSALQISLGATTWGIDWRTRNPAITPTILSVSITVNITAGILINIGGRRTRKKEIVERMFRQDLTREALEEIRERGKEEQDIQKHMKADKAIQEGRQSETLGEAVKSHVPVRDSLEVERYHERRSMDVARKSTDGGRGSWDFRKSSDERRSRSNEGSRSDSAREAIDRRFPRANGGRRSLDSRRFRSPLATSTPATPTSPL